MKHAYEDRTEAVYRALRYFNMGKESKALALVEVGNLLVTPFLEIHECPEILDYEGTVTVMNPKYYGVFKLTNGFPTSKKDGLCVFNIRELFQFSQLCENKMRKSDLFQ